MRLRIAATDMAPKTYCSFPGPFAHEGVKAESLIRNTAAGPESGEPEVSVACQNKSEDAMRTFQWTIIVASLLIGCKAGGISSSNQLQDQAARNDALGNYERYCFDASTVIPDGDPAGAVIGPLRTSGGGTLVGEIVLEISVSHSYTGDVVVELCYDADNDGQVDVKVPVDLFRSRLDPSTTGERLAYPMELEGSYYFRDDNPIEAEEWTRATKGEPAGSELAPSRTFSALRAFRSGGSFYLAMADTSAQNTGSVSSWSVLLRKDQPRLAENRRDNAR